jgi:hypothetical protein
LTEHSEARNSTPFTEIVAIKLAGYGQSGMDEKDYTIRGLANNTLQVIDSALKEK